MSEQSNQFLDKNGLVTLVNQLKEYIGKSSDIVKQFGTLSNFPNIGNEGCLYIDKSTNKSYRWDDTNLKYYCVGSNFNDIEIISGGSSES